MLSLLLFTALAAPTVEGVTTPADQEARWISFRSGTAVQATILEVREDRVVARIPSLGVEKAEIPFTQLSRATALQIMRDRVDLETSEGLERLADLAIENEMYRRARTDLARAIELDPERSDALNEKLDRVTKQGAAAELARAQRLEEIGEISDARARYRALATAWPETEAAAQAEGRVQELTNDSTSATADSDRSTEEREADKSLTRVTRILERGREDYRKALENADDLGDAEDLLLDSAGLQQRAIDKIEDIATDAGIEGSDPAQLQGETRLLADRLIDLEEKARVHLLSTRVALGHHYISAGDTLEAHRYAALAQSVDPEAPRVLNLLESVAAATARDPRRRR